MRLIGTINKVHLAGLLDGPITPSHTLFGQHFYKAVMVVKRESGVQDKIPITISEKWKTEMEQAKRVNITGSLRCYNMAKNGKAHMGMTVFVKNCTLEPEGAQDLNEVSLFGEVYREPLLKERKTKKLAQFLLAVYRDNKHPDVIPCMSWNQDAERTAQLSPGTKVKVHGRIQSRLIKNKTEITYEVSANNIEVYEEA